MTEQELRRRVCARAEGWLGRREEDGGHREIIDLYNAIRPLPRGYRMSYDDPWCAAFVSAVGAACGLSSALLPECGCEPMIALYRAAGRFEEDESVLPAPGDLVFYDWQDDGRGDCRGEADHVGLVTAVEGETITVIEGNCADSVARRRIVRDACCLRGFARPDYASAADAGSATPADSDGGGVQLDPGTADAESRISDSKYSPALLPILRRGDTGPAVEAAQLLLIARGFTCGTWGADGDFGAATFGAVYRFQKARALRPDGAIGPETWPSLVGGIRP